MHQESDQTSLDGRRSWRLFARLYRESMSRHWRPLILALLCMVAVAIASSTQTYLMGPLIDKVFIARDGTLLWLMAGGVLAIFAVRSLARYLQEVLLVMVGQKIVAETQDRLFHKLLRHGVDPGEGQPFGALAATFVYDVNMMRLAVCDVFLIAGKDTLTILTMIGLMVYTNWKLALVCLVLPVLSILPMKYIGRSMRNISLRTQAEVGALSQSLTTAFQGARTVKAYGLEPMLQAEGSKQMSRVARLVIRGAWIGGAILPIVDGLGGIAIGIVILFGGWQVIAGAITPGNLFVFVGAVVGAYAPIPSLSKVNSTLQTGLAAAERVFELMDREPSV
ncbi:ABC transporter transmembrane domain-containing protein, partial [Caulobacter sp. Root342]|uniref:ABC transporter permease n=1 Tax=Caulobacter sp. Root342 TaxID=1736519 RepID=UPI001910146F